MASAHNYSRGSYRLKYLWACLGLLLFSIYSCNQFLGETIENTGIQLKAFNTPAFVGQKDVKDLPPNTQKAFFSAWSDYVNGWTEYAISVGLQPDLTNSLPGDYYFNPLKENPETNPITVPARWNAFPYRIRFYYADYVRTLFKNDNITVNGQKYPMSYYALYQLADLGPSGFAAKYPQFKPSVLPSDLCGSTKFGRGEYTPIGPRGWLDEYSEFAVRKDESGEITSVMFTSENPEYYWTLWSISPETVLNIYQTTLQNPNIQLEDLYLKVDGVPVKVGDRYAYNPINKWNRGTQMDENSGGAIHLTSSPNELSAEVILAAGACIPRSSDDNYNVQIANDLVCCSQYGRRFRNSDPHIGQSVNQAISNASLKVAGTLLNPVSLYMQLPNFDLFELPQSLEDQGYTFEDCWTVLRGDAESDYYPNSTILRAVFSIPESWNIKASDIKVAGKPLLFASQISETVEVQLVAVAKQMNAVAPTQTCAIARDKTLPSISFANHNSLYEGFVKSGVDTLSNFSCNPVTSIPGSTQEDILIVVSGFDNCSSNSDGFGFEFFETNSQETTEMSFTPSKVETKNFQGSPATFIYGSLITPDDTPSGGKSIRVICKDNAGIQSFITPAYFRVSDFQS